MPPFSSSIGRHAILAFLLALAASSHFATGQTDAPPLGALKELSFANLSDRNLTPLGTSALGIRPNEWKHAESANFVYHFFQSFVAAPVAQEAEYYYRVVAAEMEKETAQWERKCHVFIFEKPEDWRAFQGKASLDPWTGGICAGSELFILRDPSYKWKGNTLGHEVAHLVANRFFGSGLPLWIREGHAEYAASRGYAAFHRLRGYRARPRTQAVDPARFIALARLTNAMTYPVDPMEVAVFYDESERLVRFLSAANKQGFARFFDALSKGNQFETALNKGFAGRFINLDALEREFKDYATKEHGTALQD
jgi:hypothetical protein